MSAFNVFYLLFKSNSDDVIKGNKAIEKSTKDTERALKNTNDQTKEIGQNFVKMVEGAAGAVGTFIGAEVLKTGIIQAKDYNQQLGLMGRLLGQNVNTLDTFARAAQAAGGTQGGALSDFNAILSGFASRGQKIPSIEAYIAGLRERIKNQSPNEKIRTLGDLAGIHDKGLQNIIATYSDKDLKTYLEKYKSTLKPEDIDAAMGLTENEATLGKSVTRFFTQFLTSTQKTISSAAEKAASGLNAISSSPTATVTTGVGSILAGSYLFKKYAGRIFKGAKNFLSGAEPEAEFVDQFAPKAAAAGSAGLSYTGIGTGVAMAGYGLYKGYFEYKKLIDNLADSFNGKKQAGSLSGALKNKTGQNNAGFNLPVNGGKNPASDLSVPSGDDIMNSPAAMQDLQRALSTQKHIQNAKNTLSLASSLSPATGGSVNVKIEKIDVVTQATDASGIAQSIGGKLKEEIYSHLNFLSAIFDDARGM